MNNNNSISQGCDFSTFLREVVRLGSDTVLVRRLDAD